ncbi:NUC189-domain-containing protein [Sodiomyces alkalinus F11]|uniref:NUC189-domain-containing protein n=1 Tax=Sodiomyces alkalinus (strain CBS 110278 / VKM F-3762 / F11) TaxID=1314773 RepID=A0A3N2Q193_SODAK|nr:NUC189-domain-containing protein [Sodiomyces alkalinus F11]ROT40458.1 NUC189-domain-containing protein [Sodiomyces alkalinus F11]
MSTKRKAPARFAPPTVKSSIKVSTKAAIDESRTAVSATDALQSAVKQIPETIDISSDSNSDDALSDEEADSDDDAMNGVEATEPSQKNKSLQLPPSQANGDGTSHLLSHDQTSPNADAAPESDAEATSPSFGELLRGTIDVPAILSQQQPDGASSKTVTQTSRNLAPPSLSSLSTVLTQALRTEDTELLESCLEVNNVESVQQTIERLDSSLAGVLLTKLATRFHRRPGRVGSLMIWVKWTLVAHGGALAVQPKVLDRLVGLQKVLNERSRGLPSLLALKGKLDMLDAQMQLRQNRQRRRGIEAGDSEDEEGAVYVEGEEEEKEEEEDRSAILRSRGIGGIDDDEDGAPVTNVFVGESDVDDDDDSVVVEEEGADDDGEDEGDEPLDEDDVDHDDVEDSADEDDDSDAEAAPPAKLQKVTRSFGKKR